MKTRFTPIARAVVQAGSRSRGRRGLPRLRCASRPPADAATVTFLFKSFHLVLISYSFCCQNCSDCIEAPMPPSYEKSRRVTEYDSFNVFPGPLHLAAVPARRSAMGPRMVCPTFGRMCRKSAPLVFKILPGNASESPAIAQCPDMKSVYLGQFGTVGLFSAGPTSVRDLGGVLSVLSLYNCRLRFPEACT